MYKEDHVPSFVRLGQELSLPRSGFKDAHQIVGCNVSCAVSPGVGGGPGAVELAVLDGDTKEEMPDFFALARMLSRAATNRAISSGCCSSRTLSATPHLSMPLPSL